MEAICITVKLFGAFRRYGTEIVLKMPAGVSAGSVKQALARELKAPGSSLVADAVLADDSCVLPDSHIFSKTCQLAILPPVCGG